jgi:L-asparaginase
MNNKIQIFNSGGTFNKIYELFSGKLIVPKNNNAIDTILNNCYKTNKKPKIKGLIYKDSLDITNKHRKLLVKKIQKNKSDKIIIVHGTDTMNKTAKYLKKFIKNKQIVFVGAMQPFSYEPIEATASFMMAIGFLSANPKNNIYICMNGLIKPCNKIKKNYQKSVFECQ